VFIPKLDLIFEKIFDHILFIDVKELYNLQVDSEEYYALLDHGTDEDVYLRVNQERSSEVICLGSGQSSL